MLTDVDTVFCILRIQSGSLLAFRYGLAPGVAWYICSPIITPIVISRDIGEIGRVDLSRPRLWPGEGRPDSGGGPWRDVVGWRQAPALHFFSMNVFRDFSIAVLPCGYGSWIPVSTGMTRLVSPAG